MPAYSKLPETELLKRLKSGDDHAFTEIYHRYWEKLLAIGYYHTHDKQMAEDIVHEVMMSLWTRKADLDIKALQSYLATAVKFAVFKAVAREKRRKEILAAQALPGASLDLEEKLDARFMAEFLQGAVEQLPEKARLVFKYSRHEELTIVEIAGKMDLSPKTVEYHLTKALRALKKTLLEIKIFFI